MAIARITGQDARAQGSGSTGTATYPGATTAGNLLLATIFANLSADTLDISGWTKVNHIEASNTAAALFYKLADGTETNVNFTGGNSNWRFHIYEYSGNANPIVVDQTAAQSNANNTTASTPSITTTNANNLIFAVFVTTAAVITPTFSAPFNTLQEDASGTRLFDGDRVVSATGTYSATASWTNSAVTRTIIAGFSEPTTYRSNLALMGVG